MKYSIQDGIIVLSQVGNYYEALRESGRFHWDRRSKSMRAPLSVEAINILEDAADGHLPRQLREERDVLEHRAKMLQYQREHLADDVVGLVHYPVKANLMRHQLAGANMALITFGLFDERNEHNVGN